MILSLLLLSHSRLKSANSGNCCSRIIQLDYIRCLAILFVVICHCSERLFGSIDVPRFGIVMAHSALFALGRLGVPLFLFLTGSLVLSKLVDTNDDAVAFYKRKLLPLATASLLCTALYYFRAVVILGQPFDFLQAVRILLLLENCPCAVLWYLPMIIGIYMALPFVATVCRRFSQSCFYLPLGILFVTQFVLPFISSVSVVFGYPPISGNTALDISFLGGTYGVYVVLGFYLQRNIGDIHYNPRRLFSVGIISFISLIGMQWISLVHHRGYSIWYSDLLVLIASFCLYIGLLKCPKFSNFRVIELISKASFGIYLVHFAIIDLFELPFSLLARQGILMYLSAALLLTAVVFAASFGLIQLTGKISPRLARLLYLFKD